MPEGKIYAAMIAAMKGIGAIGKGRKNQQQNYAFRGIDDVYYAARPALEDAGIVILPEVLSCDYTVLETKSGGNINYCRMLCRFHFVADDGSQ